jgi:hypothetical protein
MLGGLIPIAGGVLASSGFIISRKPDAKVLIDRLVPYMGWIGVVMFGWGVWELIGCLTHLSILASRPAHWAFWLATGLSDFAVGFLLGFGLISKYAMNRNETVKAKGQALRQKLVKIQAPLGLFAVAMGVLYLVVVVF